MSTERDCGCCEGIAPVVSLPVWNRPGLSALKYRIGTHATFYESMIARLSTYGLTRLESRCSANTTVLSRRDQSSSLLYRKEQSQLLRDLLTTRDLRDPALALLDSWATLADVITFYQERLANEGFLRTALQPRSLDELARLVGYQVRPGVSSSVYLAFEVDDAPFQPPGNPTATTTPIDILIPAGTAAKSTPKPGTDEQPQTFETSRDFLARKEWNQLLPRLTKRISLSNLLDLEELYFEGVGLRIQPKDWLVLDPDPKQRPQIRQVVRSEEIPDARKTKVTLRHDVLSTARLIDQVEEYTLLFQSAFSNYAISLAMKEDTSQRVTKRLDTLIGTARCRAPNDRLQGTDSTFYRFMCDQLDHLEPRDINGQRQGDTIRTISQTITDWADKATTLMHGDRVDVLGSSGIVSTAYRPSHITLADIQTSRANAANRVVHELSILPPTAISVAVAHLKSSLWNEAFDNGMSRPFVVFGLQNRHAVKLATLFVSPNAEVELLSDIAAPSTTIVGTRFVVGHAGDVAPAPVAVPPSTLRQTIQSLKVSGLTNDDGSRWLLITAEDTSRNTIVAAGLQELFVDGRSPSNDFPLLQNEKTIIIPRHAADSPPLGFPIDDQFTLVNTTDPSQPYEVELELIPSSIGEVSLNHAGFTLNNRRITIDSGTARASELSNAIRHLKFTPASWETFRQGWVVIVIKAPDANGNVRSIAAALRELVQNTDEITSVRARLGRLHGDLTTADTATITQSVADCQSDLDHIGPELNQLHSIYTTFTDTDNLSTAMSRSQDSRPNSRPVADAFVGSVRAESLAYLQSIDVDAKRRLKIIVEHAASQFARFSQVEADEVTRFSDLSVRFTADLNHRLSDLIAEWSPLTPLDAAQRTDTARSTLYNSAKSIVDGADAFKNSIFRFATDIADELTKVQAAFQMRLNFRTTATDVAAARLSLVAKALADYLPPHATSAAASPLPRAGAAPSACDPRRTLAYQLNDVLAECGSPTPTHVPIAGTPRLFEIAKEPANSDIARVIGQWKALIAQLTPRNGPLQIGKPVPDLSDVAKIVKAINAFLSGSVDSPLVKPYILEDSDLLAQVAARLDTQKRESLFAALRQFRVSRGVDEPRVYALRRSTRLFGWNAPDTNNVLVTADDVLQAVETNVTCLRNVSPANDANRQEFKTAIESYLDGKRPVRASDSNFDHVVKEYDKEAPDRMFLDGAFDQTLPGTVVAVQLASLTDELPQLFRVTEASSRPRSAYGLHGEATRVVVSPGWWTPIPGGFDVLRSTRIFCDAELLKLAEAPLPDGFPSPLASAESSIAIALDQPAFKIATGHAVIIEGQRNFSDAATVFLSRELVRVDRVTHTVDHTLFGDRYVTNITLTPGLKHSYRRDSVRIYANVVEATHGETQKEILGSGSGAESFREFVLKRAELSLLPAPTPRGTESTLKVRVNDVVWDEQLRLTNSLPDSRHYVTHADASGLTTVTFGDGIQGARLPTGVENVRAQYRTGLGKKGNVGPDQVNQLVGAPVGAKKVNNPLKARGGADPDSPGLARTHIPLTVTAMDRLVSVADYADFSRAYAGIGKASATLLNGTVHVTVAGIDSEPLDSDGPRLTNLQRALELFGDPSQQFHLQNREAALLIIVARVRIDADREWDKMEPLIRKTLLDRFSYENSDLGRDLLLSDAVAAIQRIDGVIYVDVDAFDSVSERDVGNLPARLGKLSLRPRIPVPREWIYTPPIASSESGPAASTPAQTAGVKTNNCFDGDASTTSNATPLLFQPGDIVPAQLCYLSPDIHDTLILEQIR